MNDEELKANGYWWYEIHLNVPGLGMYSDEDWNLLEGVIPANTRPVAEQIAQNLVIVALDKHQDRFCDELNWMPKENDPNLRIDVKPYEPSTLADWVLETAENLELAKELSNANQPALQVGDWAKVVSSTDETCDTKFVGWTGKVVRILAEGNVGDTPENPLYELEFEFDGEKITEQFWREELESNS